MAQVAADVDAYPVRLKRLTLTWVLVALVLFPVLAVLGFVMRVVQAGYFAGAAARVVLRGDDAARPRHGGPVVRRRHGRHQPAAREIRPTDARRLVDRLRRHAHRGRAAARGDAHRPARGRLVLPLPAPVPFRRHLAAVGDGDRCSRRSRSWAWAGRCGRAICCGPSRVVTGCPTRWVGSISPGATRRKCLRSSSSRR